jgi:hypothetical protein
MKRGVLLLPHSGAVLIWLCPPGIDTNWWARNLFGTFAFFIFWCAPF